MDEFPPAATKLRHEIQRSTLLDRAGLEKTGEEGLGFGLRANSRRCCGHVRPHLQSVLLQARGLGKQDVRHVPARHAVGGRWHVVEIEPEPGSLIIFC